MSVLGAHWLDLTLVTGRAVTWAPRREGRLRRPVAPGVREGLVDLFVERAQETGASVERIDAADGAALARATGGRASRRADVGVGVGVDVGVGHATLGVATSGCVVLTTARRGAPGPRDTPRLCVLHVSTLVFGVPEAVALLDRRRGHTWLRGAQGEPDLELDRVGAVREQPGLHVVLVG